MNALTIALPMGFAGLPIGDSPAETERAIRATAAQLPVHFGQGKDQAATGLGVLAAVLAPHHVRLFGRFAVPANAGPALATLVLATVPGTAATLGERNRDPHTGVCRVDLPIGPAVLTARAGDYPTLGRSVFTAEFQIPLPDNVIVLLTVTTHDEAGWPPVVAEATRVATSLRFEDGS